MPHAQPNENIATDAPKLAESTCSSRSHSSYWSVAATVSS